MPGPVLVLVLPLLRCPGRFSVILSIASASAATVREVGYGQKMTEIDIEGGPVEGCHDTRDFR